MVSPRLAFEPLVPAHAAALVSAFTDPEVWRYIDGDDGATVDEIASTYAAWTDAAPPGQTWLNLAVRRRDGGAVIGRIQATIHGNWAEIAYVLGRAWWGHGYGREAMAWLRDHLRDTHGVSELWAAVTPGNAASVRLLEALAFEEVPTGGRRLDSEDPGDRRFRWRAAPV